MENSDSNQTLNNTAPQTTPWLLIGVIITVVIFIVVAWQYTGDQTDVTSSAIQPPIKEEVRVEAPSAVDIIVDPEQNTVKSKPALEEITIEPKIVKNPLPVLDESDTWIQSKLPTLTWRKELLKLVVDDDMIRRFVVFTDNFAQGIVAYEHSPFALPASKFSPKMESVAFKENQNVWQWDEQATRRFSLYVDLLRSFDSESLVQWYGQAKPLIDQAYAELGYSDDFTVTLQEAITRVLDMELPKTSMDVVRSSVMYQYQDATLESLPAVDKLLLRIGRENLLVIKSVLLELNEKLAQQENGIH